MTESQLIFIVDDDPMVTEGLCAGLEREGRTIVTCNDIESAQLMVERMRPSHIVCDVRMSGAFGFEGLDFIRYAKRFSPDSRVVLMTGDAPEALQMEASERGAVAFLKKPFELSELDSLLNIVSSAAGSSAAGERRVIRVPLLDEILKSDALHPFFQPIVALDGKWGHVGYEALTRYRTDSPYRNPETLFKYAVRKDRVCDLEVACLRRSIHTGKQLIRDGMLTINVHPEVFAFGRTLRDALVTHAEKAGISLSQVVLEITEQASITEPVAALEVIRGLQNLGVRFAFDDVGVAYSHLTLIDKIRPEYLKVSQDFGTRFEADSTKTKIVMNLLSLARDFKCALILEGIEDESTALAAAELKIPYGQGFFFGAPADASTFSGV